MRRPKAVNYPRPKQMDGGFEYRDQAIEALAQRLLSLERIVEMLKSDISQLYGERRSGSSTPLIIRDSQLERFPAEEKVTEHKPERSRGVTDSRGVACDAYLKLSAEGLRGLPVEPVFALLDMESSARGSAIGEAKRNFTQSENKQSAFVIFRVDAGDGWLFPNPRISFTEAMKYVFPGLSHENFEEAKIRIDPKRVRPAADGAWESAAE